jgi:hypothetical protein
LPEKVAATADDTLDHRGSLESGLSSHASQHLLCECLPDLAEFFAYHERGESEGVVQKFRPHPQDKSVAMVSKGTKTAADAARLFNVHPATVSRLLANVSAEAIGVKV